MKKIPSIIVILFSISLLSACNILSPTNEDSPAKLVRFDEEVSLRQQWSVNIGKGQGKQFTRLRPAIVGDSIFAAGENGIVIAINRETGRSDWRVNLDSIISGGVGVGGDLVLVGTVNSQVIALNKQNGDLLWQSEVSSEVLSSPVTDGDVVVVQAIDGKLTGLDAQTGEQVWIYESTVPALSLRGTSSPVIQQGYVLAAFANGTVVSIALDNGTLRWEERVAIPTGRSEIDRLVDIDGELFVNDAGLLLVPSYQGYIAVIDVVTGQTRWRIQESSTVGAGTGFGNVYVSDEFSHVNAYKIGQDEVVWSNDQLDLRKITAPTGFNNYVVVADYEGYLHLLSQIDGHYMGRQRVDRKGVRVKIITQDNTLYVYGNSGNLVALRVE